MNLVFIGSSKFSLRCLSVCLKLPELRVVGVVTSPQTFTISYRPSGVTNVLHADMAGLASSEKIPLKMLERSMNDAGLLEAVAKWKPDAFLVAGWYHMIPKNWRELAPAYGLHASLLPDYSGGAPLVWAMINGETKTGITLFQMDDGVDSGPIIGQKEEPIHPNDTIATLYARIEDRGVDLLQTVLPQLVRGTLTLRFQDETKRHIFHQRSEEDGMIDWTNDAESIDRFIRAQTRPYPGAFSYLKAKPLHIWCAQVTKVKNDKRKPGFVERTAEGVYTVVCGVGAIILNEISYEKKSYAKAQIVDVFGMGGQSLDTSASCLNNNICK